MAVKCENESLAEKLSAAYPAGQALAK